MFVRGALAWPETDAGGRGIIGYCVVHMQETYTCSFFFFNCGMFICGFVVVCSVALWSHLLASSQ